MKTINLEGDVQKVVLTKTDNGEWQVESFSADDVAQESLPAEEEDIRERVKSFEDAMQVLGGGATALDFTNLTKGEIAFRKLRIIQLALNQGWEADWSDINQTKYYPWFRFDWGGFAAYGASAGLVFALTAITPAAATASVGARLCFKSEELAEYAGITFCDLYSEWLFNF